jgi:uncharacterized protein
MIWNILKYFLMAVFLSIALLLLFSEKLLPKIIFRPKPIEKDFPYQFSIPHSEGFIPKRDGGELNFIQLKAEMPRGAILYFHGNRDNLIRWGEIAASLTQYDYDVFVLDYSGYGKSTGQPSEEAILEDALTFYEFIDKNFEYSRYIYFGRSLGSGVASYLSSIHSPEALILETPYDYFGDVVSRFYPLFEYSDHYPKQLHNSDLLANANFPILILHGSEDKLIPVKFAEELYNKIEKENVQMTIIQGGGHNDLEKYKVYHEKIALFFQQL